MGNGPAVKNSPKASSPTKKLQGTGISKQNVILFLKYFLIGYFLVFFAKLPLLKRARIQYEQTLQQSREVNEPVIGEK